MEQLITGIHHITAIAGHTQKNIDFYAGILGLRLVKKIVNFDAPEVYHFYYGDEAGNPGSILTFFPYEGLVKGRHEKGMLNTTIDETVEHLGEALKLPVQFEPRRAELEKTLIPITINYDQYK